VNNCVKPAEAISNPCTTAAQPATAPTTVSEVAIPSTAPPNASKIPPTAVNAPHARVPAVLAFSKGSAGSSLAGGIKLSILLCSLAVVKLPSPPLGADK